MKHRTHPQAAVTVTIKTATETESFFFYDNTAAGEIAQAIYDLQLKTGAN